jgi:transposase
MKNKEFIGIDVSKNVLDIFILKLKFHFVVSNDPAGFAKFLETCCVKLSCTKDKLFFCFENTGRYSRLLSVFFHESEIMYAMVPALDIKQSKGMTRGKSDKRDAKSIALYAWRKKDELKPTKLHSAQTSELRQLVALRDKLIKHRTAYKNSIKDLQDCYYDGETRFIKDTQVRMINQLNDEIMKVEQRMDKIIAPMPECKNNYQLIQTVRGVGPVIARYLIIFTENFARFVNYRKFACYAGIAPFEYSLLNLAAMNAIQIPGEYKQYYLRRQNEGKNNMSTLNIIRNKLLARIFAVVKRQTPYVDIHKFVA